MRVVVDCNVLISAGLGSTACRKVIFSIADYHTFVLSTDILREYVEVSAREKFNRDQQTIRGLIRVISWNCIITEPLSSRFTLPDKKDQMYLDAAVSSMADVIVTGNKKHFPEPEYDGTRILSPRRFLELVHAE